MVTFSTWAETIEKDLDVVMVHKAKIVKRMAKQEIQVKQLTKRVDIADVRLAMLSKKYRSEKRGCGKTQHTRMVDRSQKTTRTSSVARLHHKLGTGKINIDPVEVERGHHAKHRKMLRDWSLLTFPSTDAREEFKKFLNWANRAGGTGVPFGTPKRKSR